MVLLRRLAMVLVTILVVIGLIIGIWILTVETNKRRIDTSCSQAAPHSAVAQDAALQALLEHYSQAHDGVGLQAAIIFPDDSRWAGAAGFANHDRQCGLANEHYLYIGSVSKFITAVLVLEQVDRGVLSLDDSIDRWVDLPYASQVSVRMLLNHTSGIPSYTEDMGFLLRYLGLAGKRWQPTELLGVIEQQPLKFTPGSRHEYSNSNYLLLGMILEQASGVPYSRLLAELSERAVGDNPHYYRDYPGGLPIASAYDISLNGVGRVNLTGMRLSLESGAFAAGGVLSNAAGVAETLRAVFGGQVISADRLAEMTTFVPAPDKDVSAQTGYGLGARKLVIDGQTLLGHTGTIPGYSAVALHNPEKGYTIVVLSNLSVIDQVGLFAQLQQEVLTRLP